MKFLILTLFLFSFSAMADNFMRVQDLTAQVKTTYTSLDGCAVNGDECVQIDGVDLNVNDYVNGAFVLNQSKVAARQAANAEADRVKTARQTRLARMLQLAQKAKDGTITATERNEALGLLLKDYIRELKELD